MIAKDIIDKIRDTADILEVIGDFVQLKKSGSSYKGLSPFVNENTPSFMVSPSKNIFKDFASGKGGDSISFIMEHEALSYVEALKYLANKYGIEVEEEIVTPEQQQARDDKESLYVALNYAKNLFVEQLQNTDEGKAVGQSYFKERGFFTSTIEKFELGFTLDSWSALYDAAKKAQYKDDILEKAGLIIKKDNGKVFDRFRNRVMFPIHNVSGKVIAFGARILVNDKKQPKYLNSPETEVYHKSDILYGIYQAKNQIRNLDTCFLVEGYTDVISLHQSGVENVVASSGTALTKEQIRLIKRYTKNVTVLYDGDAAGIRASIRGIDLILEEDLNVKVVLFPDGEDPDSYCRKLGGEGFKNYLAEKATDFISFKTDFFLEEAANDPIKKAEVVNEILESISKIPDAIKRAVFLKACSDKLGVSEDILQESLTQKKEQNKPRPPKPRPKPLAPLPSQEDEPFVAPPDDLFMPPDDVDGDPDYTPVEGVVSDTKGSALLNQEREIARLLITYGESELQEGVSVLQYILREITEVEFESETIGKMVTLFKDALEENKTLTRSYFLNHEDESVGRLAVDLMSEKYELSDRWESFSIFPKRETDFLEQVAYDTILRMKWQHIKSMMKNVQVDLMGADEEDEIIDLQKKYMRLKQIEMSIAQILGNVTTS